MGFGEILFRQLAQTLFAVKRHKYRRHQGDQRLIGADIRRGFLSSNMLLAGCERQAKSPVAAGIFGLAYQTAGQLSHVLVLASDDAGEWPAIAGRNREALQFPRDDIGIARRFQQSERHGLGKHEHQQRAFGMGHFGNLFGVFDHAEEIRRLNDHRGGIFIEGLLERFDVHLPGFRIVFELRHGSSLMTSVGSQHFAIFRMDCPRHGDAVAPGDPHGHHGGFGHGGGSVIHRSIGHIHARQLADHGLEFKDRCERALRNLGLVWRVGSQKLAA